MSAMSEEVEVEEFEYEVGEPPVQDVGPSAEELASQKAAAEAKVAEYEAKLQQQNVSSQLNQFAELQKLREERELMEKREKLSSQNQQNGFKPLTDADYAELEEKMLKDPKSAIKDLTERMRQRELLPMMQGMYAEIENLKLQTTKQSALSDGINKDIYSKYGKEVEAEMMNLGANVPNRFDMALNLVKARHMDEILEAKINERLGQANATSNSSTSTARPGNVSPSIQSAPVSEGKRKVYVSPEFMAQKPDRVSKEDWIEYGREIGKVK